MIGFHYIGVALIQVAATLASSDAVRDHVIATMPLPIGQHETVVLAWHGKLIEAAQFENGFFEATPDDGYRRITDGDLCDKVADLVREQSENFNGVVWAAHLKDPPPPDPRWQDSE